MPKPKRKPILTREDYKAAVGAAGAGWMGAPEGGWTDEERAAMAQWSQQHSAPTDTGATPQIATPTPPQAPPTAAAAGGDLLTLPPVPPPSVTVNAGVLGTSERADLPVDETRFYYSLGAGQTFANSNGQWYAPNVEDVRVSNQNPVTGQVDVMVKVGGKWVKADTDVQKGEFTTRYAGPGSRYGLPTVPEPRYEGAAVGGTVPVPTPKALEAPQLPTVKPAQEFTMPEMAPQFVDAGMLAPGVSRGTAQLPFTEQDYAGQGERLTGLLTQAQSQVYAYEDALSNLDTRLAVEQDTKRADSMRAGRELLQRQLELARRQEDRLEAEQTRIAGLSADLVKAQKETEKERATQEKAEVKAVADAEKEREGQAKEQERRFKEQEKAAVGEAKSQATFNSTYRAIDIGAALAQAQSQVKTLFDPDEIAAANERIQGMKNQQVLIKAGQSRIGLPPGVVLPENSEEIAALDAVRIDALTGAVHGLMDDGNWATVLDAKRVYDAQNDRWLVQIEGQWFIAGEGTDFTPRGATSLSPVQTLADAMGQALLSGDRDAFERLNAGR